MERIFEGSAGITHNDVGGGSATIGGGSAT